MILVLLSAGISLYPLFNTDLQSSSSENKEITDSIRKALKKKELKLLPQGDYDVVFTQKDGYWFATSLVSDKDLIRLAEKEDIDRLEMKHCEISAAGYSVLKNEPIVDLCLFRAHLNPSVLNVISQLSTLKKLTLRDNKKITNKLMNSLTGPSELESLDLKNTGIGDGTIKHVIKTFPHLKSLNLRACRKVSNRGLEYLSDLKNLEELNLNNTNLDRASITILTRLNSLKQLEVVGCGINDNLLKLLSGMPLVSLNFSENPITSQGLELLTKMRSLKSVRLLSIGSISKADLVRFSKVRRDCSVDWSAMAKPENENQIFQRLVTSPDSGVHK